jgi:hypothetical protein
MAASLMMEDGRLNRDASGDDGERGGGGGVALSVFVSQFPNMVMPGLDPGIHDFLSRKGKTWMAGSSPAMTIERMCVITKFARRKFRA